LQEVFARPEGRERPQQALPPAATASEQAPACEALGQREWRLTQGHPLPRIAGFAWWLAAAKFIVDHSLNGMIKYGPSGSSAGGPACRMPRRPRAEVRMAKRRTRNKGGRGDTSINFLKMSDKSKNLS
jgi:hypothetical protein